jgi:DNA-binding MarR family transcriptional regulator
MSVPSGPVSAATDAERAMFDFVDAYDRAYETTAAKHGLSAAQACVLGRLTEPRGMRELADELGCDASNVTQIIARLERRDLVQRQTNSKDRRSRQVVRAVAGDALYADFEASFAFARAAIANLAAEEQQQLVALLRKALGTADS